MQSFDGILFAMTSFSTKKIEKTVLLVQEKHVKA